jgi:N-acetylneuraminic acid mutarotase
MMRSFLLRHSPVSFLLATAFLAASTSSEPSGGHVDFASPLAWKKLAAGSTERFAFGSAFDPKHECFLVYGGESNTKGQFGLPDDLWTYKTKENTWQQVTAQGTPPSRRAYHMTAFDEKRGVMWVFGGAGEQFAALGDLWKLDTATMTWSEVTPSGDKPGARFSAGLAYDPAHDQLVLFSGCKAFFQPDSAWPDVWTYDIEKNSWSKKKAAAPPRWQAACVLDPESGTLIVQGGFDGNANAHIDTWMYSLADDKWTEAGKGFKSTEAHGAVWDPLAHAMIVYGGTSGAKNGLDQLWVFDPKSKKWSQLATKGESPGSRAYHALVWNPSERSVWAFGGTLNQFMDEPRKNEAWSLQLHK